MIISTRLDYADQRFYASTYGRFNTADRLGGKVKDPGSLNKYSYVRGDPVNRNDPKGLCDTVVAGIASANPNSAAISNYASQAGAITVFPYSLDSNTSNLLNQTLSVFSGVLQVAAQKLGPTSSTYASVLGLIDASQDGSPINVTAYSGGAGSFTAAVNFLNGNGGSAVTQLINNITYIDPGAAGSLYDNGKTITLTAGGTVNSLAGLGTNPSNVITDTNPGCANTHDFSCIARDFAVLLAQRSGPSCSNQQVINQEDGIQFENRWYDSDPAHEFQDQAPETESSN